MAPSRLKETLRSGNRPLLAASGSPPIPGRTTHVLLLVILALAWWPWRADGYDYSDLTKRAWLQPALLAFYAVAVGELGSRLGKVDRSAWKAGGWAALFLGGAVISAGMGENPAWSMLPVIHWALILPLAWVVRGNTRTEWRAASIWLVLTLVGTAVAGLGCVQYWWGWDGIRQSAPPAAVFTNKNFATHVINLCLPAALAWWARPGRRDPFLGSGAAAIMLGYLIYTQTKAAWVTAALQLLWFGWAVFRGPRRANRGDPARQAESNGPKSGRPAGAISAIVSGLIGSTHRQALLLAMGVVALMAAIPPASRPGPEAGETTGEFYERAQTSAHTRFLLWRNTWEMIRQNPLRGVGPNQFNAHYAAAVVDGVPDPYFRLGRSPKVVHNDFLQLVAEHGLSAFLALALAAIAIIREGWRRTREEGTGFAWWATWSALAGIVGWAGQACFCSPTYRAIPPLLLAVWVGLLFRSREGVEGAPPATSRGTRWILRAGVVGLFGLAIGWGQMQVRWIRADTIRNRFIGAATVTKDWPEVVALGSKLRSLHPWRNDQRKFEVAGLIQMGKLEEALALAEEYRRLFPFDAMNLYNLALLYLRLGRPEEAAPINNFLRQCLPEDSAVRRQAERIAQARRGGARR